MRAESEIVRLEEKDAGEFWRLRRKLLVELGEAGKEEDIPALEEATRAYYLAHLDKDLICWGVLQEGKLAAVGSLCLFRRLPYGGSLCAAEGYVLNIYTEKPYRRRGYGGKILEQIIAYARENRIGRLWLNSSEQGKRLYAAKGFVFKENEMELFL